MRPASASAATIPGDPDSETQAMVRDIRIAAQQSGWLPSFTRPPVMAGIEYGGQSNIQALALAAKHNPQLFATVPTRLLDPPAGATIENYLDDFSVRIDVPGQASAVIAQSLTPLRVDRGATKEPVDVKLVESGDTIAPKAPVSPVAFSRRLSDGLTVAKDIRMRLVGASPTAAAQIKGQQVFYGTALAGDDVDLFAMPLPTGLGVESFVQLRSYRSPRSISFGFELPDGARLVADSGPQPGATIMRGEDVLAAIAPPVSKDANGKLVATTMRVDGSRLTLDVAVTRATPLPVVVDPIVTDNQFAGGNASSIDGYFRTARGWRRQTSGALGNFNFTPNADDNAAGGTCARTRGGTIVNLGGQLCVGSQSARNYGGGEVGEWAFRPPSGLRSYTTDGANIPTDAYVYRADVRMNFAKLSNPATAFMYAGMRSGRDPSTYIGTSTNINPDGSGNDLRNGLFTSGYLAYGLAYNDSFYRIFCVRSDCGGDLNADNSKDGAFFTMGAWVSGSGNAIGVNAQGAIFYENDRTNPTVPTHNTSTDLSSWKKTGTVTTVVGGRDPGMGTKTVGEAYTNRSGALATIPYSSGCDGSSATPCNADLTQTLSTNIDDMPEGANQLQSYATDVLGKTGTGSALTVKVDRTAPETSMTGELVAEDETYVSGTRQAVFNVTATDARPGNSSGVARIAIEREGDVEVPGAGKDIACSVPRQCPASPGATDLTFNTSVLAEGFHDLRAVARDDAGNRGTSASTALVVDKTAPAFDTSQTFDAAWDLNTQDAVVLWDPAVDPALADGSPGSMTANYEVRYKHLTTAWSTPERVEAPRVLVPSSIVGEPITVEVKPIDGVGNIGTAKTVTLIVLPGGDVCDATAEGYPAGCGIAEVEDDSNEPPADLTEDGGTGQARTSSAAPASRFRIDVGGDGQFTDPNKRWTTFRSWRKSYVIGNARDGWSFDRLSGQSTDPDTTFGYRNGMILGGLNHCGWLQARFLAQELDSDGVSSCPQVSPVTGRPPTSKFAASVNCRNCDGGGSIMLREQDVPARGMPFCLNVDPSPLAGAPNYPRKCRDATRSRITKAAIRGDQDQLYALKWRYITRGSEQFVLVQDREKLNDVGHGAGIWGFIPRKYFANRTFCKRQNRTTPTGRSEDDSKCVIFQPTP